MLQVKAIKKQYKTGDLVQQALDGVSLNFRDSEFVAVLGPSGSGKTTLLNIIGGLDRYDSGDLIINGISTKEYRDRDWDTYRNHSIGFVFQSYNLIPHQTVLANVELALTIGGITKKERRERAKKALEDVGLGEQIHKKPNQMSGGQMQRVALARALVNNPDILLADEPTGALDTETSIQVMNLLKKVADDRLVIMVTHNPELAEEYASRIVKLRDGKIIDDTMPYTDEDAENREPIKEDRPAIRKKASMSFLTSLALSFNNLRTKKGRTILTSFAGSIGIIGIALILSLSTGVNQYISDIQKDTMTSYPITISSTSMDFSSMLGGNMKNMEETEAETEKEEKQREVGKLYINYADIEVNNSVSTSIKENNLSLFKTYLDDKNSEIHQYVGSNGIVYSYDVDFKVYTYDEDGNLVDTDVDTNEEFSGESEIYDNAVQAGNLMMSNMASLMGGTTSENATNFSEMMAGTEGEAVSRVVTDNYELLYGKWPEKYDELVLVVHRDSSSLAGTFYQLGLITKDQYRAAVDKIKAGMEADELALDYADICKKEYYILLPSDRYKKNENGTFSVQQNDEDSINELLKNAAKLKISGIVRLVEDANTQSISTTVGYTKQLTDYIIERSDKSEVITAQENNPEINVLSGQTFTDEELTQEEKADSAKAYLAGKSNAEKAALFSTVMMLDYEGGMEALMATQMSSLSGQLSEVISSAMGSAVYGAIDSAKQSVSKAIDEARGSGQWKEELESIIAEISKREKESSSESESERSSESESESSKSEEEKESFNPGEDINWDKLKEVINSNMFDQILYSYNFGDALNINLDLGSGIGSMDFSMDENDMAEMVNYWADNTATAEMLANLYDQYIGTNNYLANLEKFGKVSYDEPASISIFADSFEGKDGIALSISNYNDSVAEEDRITYTDYVALLTSSITTIINAISYVLIAFVAVSLFVSCIMIGIITNISVLERTKEIGVLRALGASKPNISQVFNAETFIIGCFSGIIGVGVSLLALIPINAIIHNLVGKTDMSAQLPIVSAGILIIISIVITIIGGLIPSRKAAKKDPVIALRSE